MGVNINNSPKLYALEFGLIQALKLNLAKLYMEGDFQLNSC